MSEKIYYADKVIIFASDYQTSEGKMLFIPDEREVSVHRVLKALEGTRRLTIYSPGANELLEGFLRHFTHVEAAGGAVEAKDGRILMIRRRGFWDLPKGHREHGEQIRDCALREVVEECGIDGSLVAVGGEITRTRHFYWNHSEERWEMKLTVWYRMSYAGDPRNIAPQTEEDITDIEWMTVEQALRNASESYMAVQEVIEKF